MPVLPKRLIIARKCSDNRRDASASRRKACRGLAMPTSENVLFPTTIAGSLPKPSWLAEPNKLWAPWRLAGRRACWQPRTTPRCSRSNCRKTPASTSSPTASRRVSISSTAFSKRSKASTSSAASRWASATIATRRCVRPSPARCGCARAFTPAKRGLPAPTPGEN